MRSSYISLIIGSILFLSCKKPPEPPPAGHNTVKHVLLKDITIPNLPSPYYHFQYNADSLITKAAFSSDFTLYDVFYSANRITEMRNNIFANQDTLRYTYDNTGKVAVIRFINSNNVVYRHVSFLYDGNQVKEIEWDHKEGSIGFLIDRTLRFSYYSDGNVKTITERRPAIDNGPEYNSVKTFEAYDDMINVDDFSLIHDGIHDHLFLLQGSRLQKNNPKKEMLSANGVNIYIIDYTYTYNNDNTPSKKTGDLLYLSGQYAGQRFQINSFFTYY